MTQLTGVGPSQLLSAEQQRRDQEIIDNVRKPGFIEAVDHAFNKNSAITSLVRDAQRARFTLDPEFVLNEELLTELSEGLPDHYIPQFKGAISEEHARFMRLQLLDLADSRNELSKLGLKGVALEIGTGFASPEYLAAGAIAAPLAFGKAAFQGMTLGQRFVRGGLVAGATDVPIEAYLAASNPEFGVEDIAIAGAASFILGGIGGGLVGDRLSKAARDQATAAEWIAHRRMAMGAAGGDEFLKYNLESPLDRARAVAELLLTRTGKKKFRKQLDPNVKSRQVDDIIRALDLDEDTAAELRALDPDEILYPMAAREPNSNGPMRAEPPAPPPTADGAAPAPTGPKPRYRLDLSWMRDVKTKWANLRFSMVGRLGASESRTARMAANALLNDTIRKADNGVSGQTVEEYVRLTDAVMTVDFYRVFNSSFDAFAEQANIPATRREAARREFAERVSTAVRRPKGEGTADPVVNRVADHVRKLHEDYLVMAKAHGVKGFEDVDVSRTYLSRIWNAMAVRGAIDAYGMPAVRGLLREAIQRATPDLADDAADKVAGAFMRTLTKLDEYTDIDRARIFSGDTEVLERVLREELAGEVGDLDSRVASIINVITPEGDKAITGRAKRRLNLDETHSIRLRDEQGNVTGVLSIEDLLENDIEKLFRLYSRQVSGASGISEFYRLFKTVDPDTGEDIIPTFDAILGRVEREMKEAGASSRKIDDTKTKLQAAHDLVLGRPINKDTNINSLLRTARGYNYINLSGQFGVAQVPEFGNALGEMGIRAMLQQMPVLRQIFKRAKDGKLSNDMLDELEAFTAQGTEWMRGRVMAGLDISDQSTVELAGGTVEHAVRKGARASSVLSFMAPINAALQRSAMAAAMQNITNRAFRNKPPSKARLASLGMDEADWDRVSAQIQKHATTEEGLLGKKVKRINLTQWDDQEAASKLIVALDKWGRRTIQQGSIGEMALWMHKDWGKTMIQFRSFVIGAYEKQFLHRLDQHDLQAWMGFQWSMFLAGTAYMGQQYVLSIGREDQADFLAERLTPANVGAVAFQRSGAASLVPAAMDSTLRILGQDTLFDKGRNTGLSADALFGNPTTDMLEQVLGRAVPSTAKAALGQDPFTEKDAQRWMRLLPFRRAFGISNILDKIAQQFPEDE